MTAPTIFGGNVACLHQWNQLEGGRQSCCLCGEVTVLEPPFTKADLDAAVNEALERAAQACEGGGRSAPYDHCAELIRAMKKRAGK